MQHSFFSGLREHTFGDFTDRLYLWMLMLRDKCSYVIYLLSDKDTRHNIVKPSQFTCFLDMHLRVCGNKRLSVQLYVLAQGCCEDGLYVLTSSPKALFASTKALLKASFEFWHSRLGHVYFNTIFLSNKQGRLSVTSLCLILVCAPLVIWLKPTDYSLFLMKNVL